MTNFRNDVAQCMVHQKDINNHSEEDGMQHYIYNIENNEETEKKVLKALEGMEADISDQSDQNIISFSDKIKAENPEFSKLPAN